MYHTVWDPETGGVLLSHSTENAIVGPVRPVFFEELDLLGFPAYWDYPRGQEPLLWAVGRRYYYRGTPVAEAKGGGFFEAPEVDVLENRLSLKPVNVEAMVDRNAIVLEGLVQRALEFIYSVHQRYLKRVDVAAVAFSGGKDSLVLIDLVQRALLPTEFVVVFSDTTMELGVTLEAVEVAKKRWSNLTFCTARSEKDASITWREFGPPSRIHRWCCSVHKSVPTLLLLRELIGSPSVRALIYDGIRREESPSRYFYLPVSDGAKHLTQTNASPLLRWNTAEVFLYLMTRGIFLNRGYRYGLSRVGCALCPFSSQWTNYLSWAAFRPDIQRFLEMLYEYGGRKGLSGGELQEFIRRRLWAGRAGGRQIGDGQAKVFQTVDDGTIVLLLREPRENWLEWSKALGTVAWYGANKGFIYAGKNACPFEVRKYDGGVEVIVHDVPTEDRVFLTRLRATANKAAYCVHCRSCEAECPTGALKVKGRAVIDESKCVLCGNCLSFIERGCLVAKSLAVTQASGSLKGLSRYQQFGLRKEWLEAYLGDPENWWHKNDLGNRQLEAMRWWLREAELMSGGHITPLGMGLRSIGLENPLAWAIIWVNLARNSDLVRWYVQNVPWGSISTKGELIDAMGDMTARRSRENGVDALVDLLKRTPLGADLGLGEIGFKGRTVSTVHKRGWERVHPLAVLYVLYRYAERTGRYKLSLTEWMDDDLENPQALFGISKAELVPILRGIASRWTSWLNVELVRDLDNLFLSAEWRSEGVPNLVGG